MSPPYHHLLPSKWIEQTTCRMWQYPDNIRTFIAGFQPKLPETPANPTTSPLTATTGLLILLPSSCSTVNLLTFYWGLYSHSTHILLLIVLPFYSHSTDDCTPILLAFYWWFYSHSARILLMILLPFCSHCTDDSVLILLALYWWFHSHSIRILLMIPLPFYSHSTDDSTPILLTLYWWFYSHSTCSLLMILLPFYSNSASGEMINKTYTTTDCFSSKLWC